VNTAIQSPKLDHNPAANVGMGGRATMTAAVLYGPQDLRIERVPVPAIGDDEVLIRVEAALTCGTDLKVWRNGSHARMIQPPAVFGHEMAGVVVATGSRVREDIRVGMRVVPANSAPCGICFYCRRGQETLCEDLLFNNGAYATFARIPGRIVEHNLLEIHESVKFENAAMIEPLACVLRGIGETQIAPGDTVVVLGCGPIGLKFVSVLAARGTRVIAIAKRSAQMETARHLGARNVLGVSESGGEGDLVTRVRELTDSKRGADAVIEAVGRPEAWQQAIQMVRRGGVVNFFGGCPRGTVVEFDPAAIHYSEVTIKSTFHHTPHYIREALAAIASGEVKPRDFVSGEISLEELPEWFQRMKDRQSQMKIVVRPGKT
jgi:L-iditol 2-dehydrogenase